MYDLSFMDTTNNIMDLMNGVDSIVPGLFSGLMMFAFFLVLLGSFRDRNYSNLMLMASFATSLVMVLLFSIELVGVVHLIVPIILLIGSIVMKLWAGD